MNLRLIFEIFKVYFKVELIRNKGFIFGLASLTLWLSLFLAPLSFFVPKGHESYVSTNGLVTILIFLLYSTASWDWAWELRMMAFNGVLDYVICSGRSLLLHFIGIVPVSLIWLGLALMIAYISLAVLIAPPIITVENYALLTLGFILLIIVLISYSLILGSVILTTGTSGPIIELITWLLPISVGGVIPLTNMPKILQLLSLALPFSYPVEIIRYSLGLSKPIININYELFVGTIYPILFLMIGYTIFKIQVRNILKNGIKTLSMF